MAELQVEPNSRRPHHRESKTEHKKLAKLPSNAKVHKRPLLRPAIPSPYAGASQQKVVYVSARTPFISTVKRVEKLLKLSDKRLVQAATTNAKQSSNKRKRGRDDHDEVLNIAKEVERLKSKKRKGGIAEDEVEGSGEEVVIKATGKAIQKAMELGLWFKQREEFMVRLRTGTVGAIDDIEVEEEEQGHVQQGGDVAEDCGGVNDGDVTMGVTAVEEEAGVEQDRNAKNDQSLTGGALMNSVMDAAAGKQDIIPETRIRHVSVLEVAVSLR